MKCADPQGLFPHSSFSLPLLISCAASLSLLHSLCFWLIPLIRLIKLNVSLGQDWWRTGGWRGQDGACRGAAVMMSNGVLGRNCTFSQLACGGRPGFRRIRLLYRLDIEKKKLTSRKLFSCAFDVTGTIQFYVITFFLYDRLIVFHGKVLACISVSCEVTNQPESASFTLLGKSKHLSNQQGLQRHFLLCLGSVPSQPMCPS